MNPMKIALLRVMWLGVFLLTQGVHAYEICYKDGETCLDSAPRDYYGFTVTRPCWEYAETYTCIDAEVNSCGTPPTAPWVYESSGNFVYFDPNDNSSPILSVDDYYTSNEHYVLSCDDPAADAYCAGNPDCDMAPLDCQVTSPMQCVDNNPAIRDPNNDGSQIYRTSPECWGKEQVWSCYSGNQVNNGCDGSLPGCTWIGFNCLVDDPLKIPEPVYGTCVSWEDVYGCFNNTIVQCDGDTSMGCTDPVVANVNQTLFGYDIAWDSIQTCYAGGPVMCNEDPDCNLVDLQCTAFSNPPDNTICSEQEQTYECTQTVEQCTNTVITEDCALVNTGDTDIVGYNSESNFGMAAQAAGVTEAMQREMDVNGVNVSLFAGESEQCKDITDTGKTLLITGAYGIVSILLGPEAATYMAIEGSQMDLRCCKPQPSDIETKGLFQVCDQEDITLAAARYAGRGHRVEGPYVDIQVCLIPAVPDCAWEPVLREEQTWCYFDSMLARIVQEQGRQQLAELALTVGADTTQYSVAFDLYTDTPGGQWMPPVNINGNQVRMWQWNSACKNNDTMSEAVRDATLVCSVPESVFFALCAHPNGDCGELPSDPRHFSGSGEWTVQYVNPTVTRAQALSRYVVAKGSCSEDPNDPGFTGPCAYDLYAWPAGQGGQLQSQTTLEWQMYNNVEGFSNHTWGSGSFEFQPYQYDMMLPKDQVTVDFRYHVLGDPWQTVSLPIDIPIDNAFTLPGLLTPATIHGQCDKSLNRCAYTVVMETMVTAKPWGNRDNPDCTGFSIEQIQVLDFDRMDLSEYTGSLDIPVLPPQAELETAAIDGVSEFYTNYNDNNATEVGGADEKVIQIKPNNGYGPFEVTAYTAIRWPLRSGGVTSFEDVISTTIDWGDGSAPSTPIASGPNQAMQAGHTYPQVNADVTYTVTVTFVSDSGTHEVTGEVLNWRTPPEMDGTVAGGATGGTTTYQPQSLPGGATTGASAIPQFTPDQPAPNPPPP